MAKKLDGRTRVARIKKYIREETEFGKKFKINPKVTKDHIKMRLAGWDDIAGLDKRGIKAMKYKRSKNMKIKRYDNRADYFTIWIKTKRKPY